MDLLSKYRKTINNLNSQLNQKERIIKKLSQLIDAQAESKEKNFKESLNLVKKENTKLNKKIQLLEKESELLRSEIQNLKLSLEPTEEPQQEESKTTRKRRTRKTNNDT